MRIATGIAALLLLLTACSDDPAPAGPAGVSPVWTIQTSAELGEVHRATAVDDTVFVIAAGGFAAFARADGKLRWHNQKQLTVSDRDRYQIAGDAVVELGKAFNGQPAVYDLATGAKRFELPVVKSAIATRDSLLVATCATFASPCVLAAHELRGGKQVWKANLPQPMNLALPNRARCSGVGSSTVSDYVEPMLAQERGVVIAIHKPFQKPITLRVVEVRTGKVTKQWQMGGTGDPGVVHLDGDHVGGRQPDAVGADSPVKPWVYDMGKNTLFQGKTQQPDKDIASCPGVGEMTMVADGANGVRIFELFTNAPLWTGPKDHRLVGAAGETAVVWIGKPTFAIAAFDIKTGTARWTANPALQNSMRAGFTGKHVVYSPGFANKTQKLTALDAATGKELWSAPNAVLYGVGSDWVTAGSKGVLAIYKV